MSYNFGATSKKKLDTCDSRIINIMEKAIEIMDFTVLCGHRDEIEQNKAFNSGRSKLRWPRSKHNGNPSKAIDVAPFPIDWHDTRRFAYLAGIIIGIADQSGIKLRWGGDWNMDGEVKDNNFNDLVHFEIV